MGNLEKEGTTFNLEKEQGKYTDVFERITKANIIPEKEKPLDLEALEQCLDEAFQKYGEENIKENEGRIFMTLSGGLDSTLCLAFLKKNFPETEIITFTIGGNENHADIVHARLVAEKFETNHNKFIPTPQEIHEGLIEYNETFPKDDLKESAKMGRFDVFLLYKHIKDIFEFPPKSMIACDGIDESMGGYWDHRKTDDLEIKEEEFRKHWKMVVPNHLEYLTRTADNFGIDLLFPYVDEKVIEEISEIPLNERTFGKIGKKPLKAIAEKMGIPKEIIERNKMGFNDAMIRKEQNETHNNS